MLPFEDGHIEDILLTKLALPVAVPSWIRLPSP